MLELNILVREVVLGQNRKVFITVILFIDYGNMVHLVIIWLDIIKLDTQLEFSYNAQVKEH